MKNNPIPSFVKRSGRLSKSQKNALENLLDKYQVDDDFLNQKKPLQVEIGFGDGGCLFEIAQQNLTVNFLGLEVHNPGVGHLLLNLEKQNLANVRVFHGDALEFLTEKIKNNSVDKIMLFFPDPWHKKRHHKRRIIRDEFIELIIKILKPKAIFHMATDWQEYAEYTLEKIQNFKQLKNLSESNNFIKRPKSRPVTKFEKRGENLGYQVWDMMWQKV